MSGTALPDAATDRGDRPVTCEGPPSDVGQRQSAAGLGEAATTDHGVRLDRDSPDLRVVLLGARHAPVAGHPLQVSGIVVEDLRHARGGQQPMRLENAQLF